MATYEDANGAKRGSYGSASQPTSSVRYGPRSSGARLASWRSQSTSGARTASVGIERSGLSRRQTAVCSSAVAAPAAVSPSTRQVAACNGMPATIPSDAHTPATVSREQSIASPAPGAHGFGA